MCAQEIERTQQDVYVQHLKFQNEILKIQYDLHQYRNMEPEPLVFAQHQQVKHDDIGFITVTKKQ